MTTGETTKIANGIVMLDMDKEGNITERTKSVTTDEWLDGTVLGEKYPGIEVALLSVPTDAVEWGEKAIVQDRMCSLQWEGVSYRLVGASGSAKNGKFYYSDVKHAPALRERFLAWPEAAITYFGILTSNCKVVKTYASARVLVVPDSVLGTNDCRGWLRRSMVEDLKLAPGHVYQTREAFDITIKGKKVGTQAKGLLKAMENDVADFLGADIVVPESSIKPLPELPEFGEAAGFGGRTFVSEMIIGVRETSRNIEFGSSYTVLQHASREVIDREIIPQAAAEIAELTEAWQAKNHVKVIEKVGKKISIDEDSFDEVATRELAGQEEAFQAAEAILLADGSGKITRHPFVHKTLSRLVAKWAFKLCTGGGLKLPGFTLVDDGYLALIDGKVCCGSNWLPLDTAIVSAPLTSKRGLCTRYPVRMAEDLLPIKHANLQDAANLLVMLQGLTSEQASWIAEHQLCLNATYTLHQDTAKRNGGDFDGDMVCVIDEERYPMFVEYRFTLKEHPAIKKTKAARLKSDWYNLEHIAMGAMGNQIGVITDLMSACLASGEDELVYDLVAELQKEIDGLKHNTCADKSVLRGIREKAPKPAWLNCKNPTSLANMPLHLDVLPTDRIGQYYNRIRPMIELMMGEPMQVSQFAGLIVGNTPTQEMFNECEFIRAIHNSTHEKLRIKTNTEAERVKDANIALESALKSKDEDAIATARKARTKALKAQELAEKWVKEKSRTLGNIVAAWSMSKRTNRKAWCQAMHSIVHNSKSPLATGSLAIHAFPQEFVDSLADRTGGIRSVVATPKVLGDIAVEGDALYMYAAGKAKTYLFRYDKVKRTIVK